MNWREHIVSEKEVLLGKPTIKGTRISVELMKFLADENFSFPSIVILREAGFSVKSVAELYPGLFRP